VDKLRIMQMTRLSDERKSRGLTFGAFSSRISHFDEEKVEAILLSVSLEKRKKKKLLFTRRHEHIEAMVQLNKI